MAYLTIHSLQFNYVWIYTLKALNVVDFSGETELKTSLYIRVETQRPQRYHDVAVIPAARLNTA